MGTLDFIIRTLGVLSFAYLIYGTWETAKSGEPLERSAFMKKIESSVLNSVKYLYIKIRNLFK